MLLKLGALISHLAAPQTEKTRRIERPKLFRKRETSRPRREGPVCVSKWEAFPVLNSLPEVLHRVKEMLCKLRNYSVASTT